MLARLAPAVLLLGAAKAQGENPSVVTFISISPVPTTEGIYTIQTSVPVFSSSACYEVCIQAPCPPCGVTSEGSMGIPPGETPIPSASISLPPVSLPSPLPSGSPVPLPSPLPSGSPAPLPSPLPSGSPVPLPSPLPSGSPSLPPGTLPSPRPSGSAGTSPSSSRTPPAEVSTAAASSLSVFQGDRTPFTLAVAVSGLALVGAAVVLL